MICFCWLGFPQYGARAIRAFVGTTGEEVVVVATQPKVPIKGMDELSGCRVVWIDINDGRSITEVVGAMPRVITVPSWSFKTFDRFRREVRHAGGKAIMVSDNNLEYNRRIIFKMVLMRLGWRFRYDGYWVPHASGRRLMRFFGVPDKQIFEGMYSADASLFNDGGINICSRPKKIIFVGQLCERKNPFRLCAAFRAACAAERGWTLDLYGCGPLKDRILQGDGITVHDFLQPGQLAAKYRESRIFCLPSVEEHWGLVVHEAALSGCALLISNRVGAAEDLLDEGVNGYSFSPFSQEEIKSALEQVFRWDDAWFDRAYERSKTLAARIDFSKFVRGVKAFCSL